MSDSIFSRFRSEFQAALHQVVTTIESRRQQGASSDLTSLETCAIIDSVVARVPQVKKPSDSDEPWRNEVRRGIIDRGLEEMVLDVALRQPESTGDGDSTAGYDILADLLDIILMFTERELADDTLPLACISALLDIQTISGCAHIFAYLESRVDLLIVNMNPLKGKGLILLRLLNELLRRLPKSKTEDVVFCGRILTFLSSSYPLGEKSGVNLRGNYNTGKVTSYEMSSKAPTPAPEVVGEINKVEELVIEDDTSHMEVDVDQTSDFYTKFWSLQRFFTNPPSLFQSLPATNAFDELRDGLSQTLDAFAAATKREKALQGASKEGGDRKLGKKKEEDDDEIKLHYFFPKFLTSRNLLELEIADPTFRRQILIQCLVLFQYLLAFTPTERVKWSSIPGPISSSQQSYELPKPNEQWINELRVRTIMEMEAMPGGARFRQTVELILRREQNWINWKLTSCQPFDLPALDPIAMSTTASNKLRGVVRKLKSWPYKIGNPVLSKLWDKNTTTLVGFESKADGNFDTVVREWRMTKKVITQRKAQLTVANAISTTDGKSVGFANQLEQLEKKEKALHWRAIRLATTQYIRHFHEIQSGDLELLLKRIEDERVKAEEEQERLRALAESEEERIETAESDEPAKEEEGAEKVEVTETDGGEKELEEGAEENTTIVLSPSSKRAASDGLDQDVKKRTKFGP